MVGNKNINKSSTNVFLHGSDPRIIYYI